MAMDLRRMHRAKGMSKRNMLLVLVDQKTVLDITTHRLDLDQASPKD